MNNLITVFMNYKINRLTDYGVFIYGEDSKFVREVFEKYFQTYIDNYYYGVFHTSNEDHYTKKVLEEEFTGIMEDLLVDYTQYELMVSNEEYSLNQGKIKELKDLSLEIIKIDQLRIENKEDINVVFNEFLQTNEKIFSLVSKKENKLVSKIRETYQTERKIFSYKKKYFDILNRKFVGHEDIFFTELKQEIKALGNYRDGMVSKTYQTESLVDEKLECLIQKVSLELLQNLIEKKDNHKYLIEFPDACFGRGKIESSVYHLISNPYFEQYVVLGVNHTTYQNYKSAFVNEFQYACIQDFTHINDIYMKTDSLINEGVYQYLVVMDSKFQDRDYFLNHPSQEVKVLVFEEE